MCAAGRLPLTILVQGGVASGKSSVARALAELGAEVVDCDALGHEALRRPEVVARLLEAFGPEVLDPEGQVDRDALGARVFSDPAALARLEAIVHPLIARWVHERLESRRTPEDRPRRVVVLDAAVAERMGLDRSCDLRVFVDVPAEVRRRRARAQRGWNPEEVDRREAHQEPLDSKRAQADAVLPNDGSPDEAMAHVKRFWKEFVEPQR